MIWYVVFGVLALALASITILVDNAFERAIHWLFAAVGISSGKGPLVVEASHDGSEVVSLRIGNAGTQIMKLAAVESRGGARAFPTPFADRAAATVGGERERASREFASRTLAAGESFTVYLQTSELASHGCRELAVLDDGGRAWPASGYPS